MRYAIKLTTLVWALLFHACSTSQVESMDALRKWINDPANGLVQTRYINGLRLQLKLLPAHYLVMKDYLDEERQSPALLDSLRFNFEKNLVFLLNIGPDEREGAGADVMFSGTQNYEAYKERFIELSFFLEDRITLQVGGTAYRPALTSLENVYGLKPDRNVNIAFVPGETTDRDFYEGEELIFTFEDDVLGTGISHFKFKRKDLENVPQLKIQNYQP